MARRTPNREFFEHLIAAFREFPGNMSRAGRQAGCDRRTAQTWWEKGMPPHFPAIKQVLADDAAETRRHQQELRDIEQQERQAEEEKKRKAEDEKEQQEQSIMKLARNNVLGAAMALAHPNSAMRKLCEALSGSIDVVTAEIRKDPASVRPERVMGLANAYARAIKSVTEASRLAIVAERVRRGENVPLEPLGEQARLTPEQAVEVIDIAREAADRARRSGLVAIDGGKTDKKTG